MSTSMDTSIVSLHTPLLTAHCTPPHIEGKVTNEPLQAPCQLLFSLMTLHSWPRTAHCEILGTFLQQHHQHPIFQAHFHAEPQGQAQAKKVDRLSSPNLGSELTVSGVTDITALLC